jgi:hypothetical protein
VAPPTIDVWGPGTRVPAIVISPFAITALIEQRSGLAPLGTRDATQPTRLTRSTQANSHEPGRRNALLAIDLVGCILKRLCRCHHNN